MVDFTISNEVVSEKINSGQEVNEKVIRGYRYRAYEGRMATSTLLNGGQTFYAVGDERSVISEYTLDEPYNVNTASISAIDRDQYATPLDRPQAIDVSPDGTKLFVGDVDDDDVSQFTMSTAFDLTTLTFDSLTYNPGEITNIYLTRFANNGDTLFLGNSNSTIYEYSTGSSYDIGSVVFEDSYNLTPNNSNSDYRGLYFVDSGSKMYAADHNSDSIRVWTLTTPYDLSTRTYQGQISADRNTERVLYVDESEGRLIYDSNNDAQRIVEYSFDPNSLEEGLTVPTGERWDVTIYATNLTIDGQNLGDGKFDLILGAGQEISASSGRVSGFNVFE